MHVPQTYTGPLLTPLRPTRGNLLSLLPYLQRRQTLLTREKGFLQSSFGLFDVAQGFKGCSWLGVHFQPTPGSLGLPAPPPFLIILCTGNQRMQKKGNWQNGRPVHQKKMCPTILHKKPLECFSYDATTPKADSVSPPNQQDHLY